MHRGVLAKIGRRGRGAIALLVFLLGYPLFALGEVRARVSPEQGQSTSVFVLAVTVSGERDIEPPRFEASPHFSLQQRGTSTQITIINGRQERSITFQYAVVPKSGLNPGRYPLPRGSVRDEALPPLTVEIVKSGAKPKSGSSLVQVVNTLKPYVGEQITHRLELASSADLLRIEASEGNFPGFFRESLGDNHKETRDIAGSNIRTYALLESLFPKQEGAVVIPERTMELERHAPVQNPQREWNMFEEVWPLLNSDLQQTVRETVTAPALTLEVQPLPPPPAPGLSYIPVGPTTVRASVDKTVVKQGEGVTLALEVESEGNLRPYELPLGELRGFKVYPEKPSLATEVKEGRVIFKKRFIVAFVPERSGEVVLPSIRIVNFDPRRGEYQFHDTPVTALTVIPDQSPPQNEHRTEPAVETVRSGVSELPPLRPLKEGASVLTHPRSPGALRWLSLLVPLSVLFWWAAVRGRRIFTPRENPLSEALQAIEAAEWEGELLTAVKRYVSRRFKVEGAGFTAREIAQCLDQHGKAGGRLEALLSAVERAQYSHNRSTAEGLKSQVREEVKALLKEIDR